MDNKPLWIEDELHFDILSVCKKWYTFPIIVKGNKVCPSPLPAVALVKDSLKYNDTIIQEHNEFEIESTPTVDNFWGVIFL